MYSMDYLIEIKDEELGDTYIYEIPNDEVPDPVYVDLRKLILEGLDLS